MKKAVKNNLHYSYPLRRLIIFLLILFVLFNDLSGQVVGDFQPRNATGNWSDFNAWNRHNGTAFVAATAGQIPLATSDIYFVATRNISVDITTAVCNNIRFSSTGITERITQNAGSVLSIYGSLLQISNANVPFPSYGAGAKIVFTGSANQTITNCGANTKLNNVEINKSGGVFTLPSPRFEYQIFTLTNGAVVGAPGAELQGQTSSANVNINGGTFTQISGASRINGGAGINATLNINSGVMTLATTSGGTAGFKFSDVNITNNGVLNLNNFTGNINVTNNFNIDITSTLNTALVTSPSATSMSFLGTVNYTHTAAQNIINTSYGSLGLSGSGSKTPTATLNITRNLTMGGSAILPLSATIGVNIGGNWTSYGQAGLTESTSTVDFNGAGAQTINTSGGENFYLVRKSGAGTLTLNSNVSATGGAGSGLNISAGIVDAGTNTLSGAGTSTLTMTGGTLRLGKLNTTLPEFTGTYAISGGTVELNGAGAQSFRGGENYVNLVFSNSGTKTLSSPINPPTNTILGTISISNAAVLDVLNRTMGGAGTYITMTGTSVYKTEGTSTKPDAQGTYNLGIGTSIEFANNSASEQIIRLSPSYANIIVSGSSVSNPSLTSTPLNIQAGGSFTVTSTGTFKHMNVNGFSGVANSTISSTNNPSINLQDGSTIEYNRNDGSAQTISSSVNVGQGTTGNYFSLTLSGSGNRIAPNTTLEIKGNLSQSGTSVFSNNNGLVLLNGTTQSFAGLDFYGLEMTGGTKTTTGNPSVADVLKINNSAVVNVANTDTITLKSVSGKTARLAELFHSNPSTAITYNTSGSFIVERHIKSGRKWRYLSVPTDNNLQTFKTAWQEGATSIADSLPLGYGIIIGDSSLNAVSNGFDLRTFDATVKTYTSATGIWNGISSTNISPEKTKAYLAFISGDRTRTTAASGTNATTLRSTGKLFVGNQDVLVAPNQFVGVGNPYASPLQLDSLIQPDSINNGIAKVLYVWDPQASNGSTNVGRFQTLSWDEDLDGFSVTPGGGSYSNNINDTYDSLESGQAFLVRGVGGGGTLHFRESAKSITAPSVNFTSGMFQRLSVNLLNVPTNGSTPAVLDGFRVIADNQFNKGLDDKDMLKMKNNFENIGILQQDSILVVERRPLNGTSDTIHISSRSLRLQNYQWEIKASNMDYPGRTGFFVDRFTNTSTALQMEGSTTVNFTVQNTPGSYANNRFYILFRQEAAGPLPVTFTTVTATRNADKTISVQWKVEQEINITKYEVERSSNGSLFTTTYSRSAASNNGVGATYDHIDAAPNAFDNFYRIKATSIGGQVQYSEIVKVGSSNNKPAITVYPNPVKDKTLQVRFEQQGSGRYQLQLLATNGQTVFVKELLLNNNSNQVQTLAIPQQLSVGNYQLKIQKPDGSVETIKLWVE